MKILLLTTHLNIGGIGVYTVGLAKYLKKNGADVTVVSSGGEMTSLLDDEDVRHITLDVKTKSAFGAKVWKAVPRLARIISDGEYDIVHAQTRVAQVLACFVGKKTGIPWVSTCHGFFRYKRLFRKLFPCWGNKVIAISKSVYHHLVHDFKVSPKKCVQIYNGIELDRYETLLEEKDASLMKKIGLDPDAFVVGAVGRLSSVKGFKYLVDAFYKAQSKTERNLNLVLFGEGPEKGNLERQICELDLAEKVFIYSGTEGIPKYFSVIDTFCAPSIHEGLGLSLMEAMAASRACIASEVGGLAELVDNGVNGLLVPVKDSSALQEAILSLVHDSDLRDKLSRQARERAMREFSIEKSVKETLAVYKKVVSKRSD